MNVLVTTSCSGSSFSYNPNQIVRDIDPVVGADLVKHGLGVELDEKGQPLLTVTESKPADQDEETGDEDSDESNDGDSDDSEQDSDDSKEGDQETAKLDESAETATDKTPAAQTAPVTPKAETATKKK